MSSGVLVAQDLHKTFPGMDDEVLAGIDVTLRQGESLAVIGASGCGKSTLLHILGGLAKPDSGSVALVGKQFSNIGLTKQGLLRNKHLGFIFQMHHLLGEFSAGENIALPLMIAGVARTEALKQARELLERLALGAHFDKKHGTLSGGERQRVSIARALINKPACVLADEPTGNLDAKTASSVVQILLQQCVSSNCALLMVTHDLNQARRLDRIYEMQAGKLAQVAT